MSDMLSAWAGVIIVVGAAVLVTLAAVLWIMFFRKNARRRRRRRQRSEHYQPNPTLADIGGLPPMREGGEHTEAQSQR